MSFKGDSRNKRTYIEDGRKCIVTYRGRLDMTKHAVANKLNLCRRLS